MRKIILEVAWWSVLMAVGLMIWVYVGADNRASHWEWELRPYVAFWDKHITGFISGDGAPYATLLYVVAAIFLLLLSFRLLVFVAKLVLGFTIAQTALFTMGTQGIWQPALALYGAAGVSVAWLVASMFIQKIGIGQGFRNLWRQIRS